MSDSKTPRVDTLGVNMPASDRDASDTNNIPDFKGFAVRT